jgi:hypothetical protein
LAAFTLESNKLLKADSQDTATNLLQAISWQLGNVTTSPLSFPSPAPLPRFHISASSLRINTFWVLGLVLSLSSALLGILVKQWLREYLNWGLTSPRDSVRMRQFRYEGLVSWRVSDIVAALPLLLEMSLILFLIGLLDLLWTINIVIASCTTIVVSITLIMVLISVILPFFFSDCPFKSPLSFQVRQIFYHLSQGMSLVTIVKTKSSKADQRGDEVVASVNWW